MSVKHNLGKKVIIITVKKVNVKSRIISSSFIFSFILMIFPVASGVIVTINNMDTLHSYWIQGAFMLFSIIIPLIFLKIKKMKINIIGFVRADIDSVKTVLYFIPLIAAKIGFLLFVINNDIQTIIALVFFTAAIGLSEEIYFRGLILRRLMTCFTIKKSLIISSALFAAVHVSQAFSGTGFIMVILIIINALIFGIVASEIVLVTKSLIPVIIWHALYDFINWLALVQGSAEIILVIIQSSIMIIYAGYLWSKLPE